MNNITKHPDRICHFPAIRVFYSLQYVNITICYIKIINYKLEYNWIVNGNQRLLE